MTHMRVAVRTADEAAAVLVGGGDGLVLTQSAGSELARVAAVSAGRCPLAVLIAYGEPLRDQNGADEVIVSSAVLAGAAVTSKQILRCIVDAPELDEEASPNLSGVMFEAARRGDRVLGVITPAMLHRLVSDARARGLWVMIAGAIEPPDVPRLLALAPDALLLDAVVREDGHATGRLDLARLAMLRDMIPRRSDPVGIATEPIGADGIFVRDWVVTIPVGTYSHEGLQRVAFTVEAEIAPGVGRTADMRDVVSYDLITDAIARATAAHVTLVETLAEDVAAAVLRHPRVRAVDLTVEKLDLGPGRVGCRLRRRRIEG